MTRTSRGRCPGKDAKVYDPRWWTLADMAVGRSQGRTLVATMTGEELREMHEKFLKPERLMVWPKYDPGKIDAARTFRVAMHPWTTGIARDRKKNLSNVEAGPEWRPQELWAEVFK